MAWIYRNPNSLGKHTGDCVIRAISIATNQSWDDTFREVTEEAFNRAEMPSWNSNWWSYIEKLGFRRHIISDTCPDCYTVKDFCYEHPYGTYILFIPNTGQGTGHVVTVKNGDYYDIWDSGNEVPLAYWSKEG